MNAASKILESLLERGEYLERLTQEELKGFLGILEKANDEIIGKIAKANGVWTKEWLAGMKADIDAIYEEAIKKIGNRIDAKIDDLVGEEIQALSSEIADMLIGISTTTPTPEVIAAMIRDLPAAEGSTLDQLCQALGVASSKSVTEALQLGILEGETIEQMVRRIRGRVVKPARWVKGVDGKKHYVSGVYEGGVMNASTRQAEALARTAYMHVVNQARESFYEDNADIIKGFQRVETLDGDTCLVCGADDGHVYKHGEPRPALPAHFSCRGVYIPVLKSFRELGIDMDEVPPGTRASMDGQVPEYETYESRLRKMSPARQDALLGPSRGKMFRDGMALKDMVRDGKVIPLDEFKSRVVGRIEPQGPIRRADGFVPAKTTREAEQWAREHDLAETVLYGKIPVEIANSVNETIWEAQKKYPELRKVNQLLGSSKALREWYIDTRSKEVFTELRRINPDIDGQSLRKEAIKVARKECWQMPRTAYAGSVDGYKIHGIVLNDYAMKDPKNLRSMLDWDVESGFHPPKCGTVKGIIDHELGHRLDYLLKYPSQNALLLQKTGLNNHSVRDLYYSIESGLSRYALKSQREFLAEAWSEYCNNPKPRPIAMALGKWIEELYLEHMEGKNSGNA